MSNELEVFDKSTLKKTEQRVKEMQANGEVDFPDGYSVSTAIKSAWLALQRTKDKNGNPVLKKCTKTSVMQSVLETVTSGLYPSRDQVDFVAYGKTLNAQPSYFGYLALIKRLYDLNDHDAQAVYENDEFDYEIVEGQTVVNQHKQSLANKQNEELIGAYCTLHFADKKDHTEVMTREQLENAWSQGSGGNSTHNKFTEEMSKKTVIKRACKTYIKSSEKDFTINANEINAEESHESQVEVEKEEKANQEVVDVEAESNNNKSDEKESPSNDPNMNGRDENSNDDEQGDGELGLDDKSGGNRPESGPGF